MVSQAQAVEIAMRVIDAPSAQLRQRQTVGRRAKRVGLTGEGRSGSTAAGGGGGSGASEGYRPEIDSSMDWISFEGSEQLFSTS